MINSKGEQGCESPTCRWVTRWLLIYLAVVYYGEWSLPSVGLSDIHRFARLCCF